MGCGAAITCATVGLDSGATFVGAGAGAGAGATGCCAIEGAGEGAGAFEAPLLIMPDACDESMLPSVTWLRLTRESVLGVCKESSMPTLASSAAR